MPENGGNDLIVHVRISERAGMPDLVEGQKVSFDVEVDCRSGKTAAVTIRESDQPYRLVRHCGPIAL